MSANLKMQHPCLNCEKADMVKDARDTIASHKGAQATVPAVYGWHCPACGEVEFLDVEGSTRFDATLQALVDAHNARNQAELRATRKRLKLTQHEAGKLTGGGPNAFSRYERGQAKPAPSVVNLFRLLDKHPELLAELQQ